MPTGFFRGVRFLTLALHLIEFDLRSVEEIPARFENTSFLERGTRMAFNFNFAASAVSLISLMMSGLPAEAQSKDIPTYVAKEYKTEFFTGYIQSQETMELMDQTEKKSFNDSGEIIPGRYSMRTVAGPVENQGQCGSCWDFSLTTVLRGTWIMAGEDPGRLSFNYLLNCSKVTMGCKGGNFFAAKYFADPKGAPAYGSDGPYIQKHGECLDAPPLASSVNYHLLGKFWTNPSFKDIAHVVGVLHRPVSADVAVDPHWRSYKSGVYNGCSAETPFSLNHMVAIEGYDCESSVDANGNCVFDANGNLPPGVGLWIIRNSWGTKWGDHGYITTKATDRNGVRCNSVAFDALYYDI